MGNDGRILLIPGVSVQSGGFEEFRDNTGIHGIKYMFESNQPLWSRILWLVSLTIAVVCCALMVVHSLQEFYTDPTVQRSEGYRQESNGFPFPAVTICNVNRFYKSRAQRFVDSLRFPNTSILNRSNTYKLLPNLAVLAAAEYDDDDETGNVLQRVLDYNNVSIKDAFTQLARPCSELLDRCRWEFEIIPCSNLFEQSITIQGSCCSFNYILNRNNPRYRRALRYGPGEGLTLLLNVASHDVLPGSSISLGVKVILHRHTDYPEVGSEQPQCGAGRECFIQISPREHRNYDTVRTLSVSRRQCFFEDEAQGITDVLPYSRENCYSLCRIMMTQTLCGCVGFFVPKQIGQKQRICNLRDVRCITKNRVMLESDGDCNCPSTCSDIRFVQATDAGDFDATDSNHEIFYKNANLSDRTVAHIYIGPQMATRTNTDVSFSIQVLMSLLGGYCSLFLGCSLISGLEVVYFSTFRALRDVWA